MDIQIVEDAILHKYGHEINFSGKAYMDKIIQIPFFLPAISFSQIQKAIEEEFENNSLTSEFWTLVKIGLSGNPRNTKRFMNSFSFIITIMNTNDKALSNSEMVIEERNFYIALLLIIRISYPEFYNYILRNNDSIKVIYDLINTSNNKRLTVLLERDTELNNIWSIPKIHQFILDSCPTQDNNFPSPPNQMIVKELIDNINLVEK